MATESGGAVAKESGGAVTTGDETMATAGDETAATSVVIYADEGPYTIDVRSVEEMMGTTRELRMATESGGDKRRRDRRSQGRDRRQDGGDGW